MKKVLYYIIIFFILFSISSTCYAKNILNLGEPVISFPKSKNYGLQGFTVVNNYLFMVIEGEDDTKAIVKVFDLETFKEIISYDYGSLGHANDVTYNSKNNSIYVIASSGSDLVYSFDGDSFQYKEQFEIGLPIRSITYIEDDDEYAVRTVAAGFKLDSSFNQISEFPFIIGMNFSYDMGRQGWTYYEGNIYYANWSWIRYGGDGGNVIYVYGVDGDRKDAFYTEIDIGEIEDIAFYNNKMILGFNGYDDNINFYMIDSPEIKEEVIEVKDKVEETKKDSFNFYWIILIIIVLIICFCFYKINRKSK